MRNHPFPRGTGASIGQRDGHDVGGRGRVELHTGESPVWARRVSWPPQSVVVVSQLEHVPLIVDGEGVQLLQERLTKKSVAPPADDAFHIGKRNPAYRQ